MISKRFVAAPLAAGALLLAAQSGRTQSEPPAAILVQRSPSAQPAPSAEILIKFRDAADANELGRPGGLAAARRPGLAATLQRHGITEGRRLFPRISQRRLDRVVKVVSERVRQDPGRLSEVLAALRARPEVEYAEPNVILQAFWVPDDPYLNSSGTWGQSFGDLWGLEKIGAELAWDRSTGAGVVVTVLDTGVDFTHPELAANLWQNAGETGLDPLGQDKRTNGVDDDGNGFTDDWRGWDFSAPSTGDNDPTDDHGHGSHVAGTIAAVGDNAVGIVGVAPLAQIMAVKVLNSGGSGYLDQISAGILYAADNGARVINASLGGSGDTPQTLFDAIGYAHDVKGVVFVAAAGNSNMDVGTPWKGTFPANLRNAVAVAAFDHTDQKASFSNFGSKTDVAAPGGGDSDPATGYEPARSILSLKAALAGSAMTGYGQLIIDGEYLRQAGTSMAAPHVAGVAALILAIHPEYSPEQVRQAIRKGADDVASAGFDTQSGYGRLNADAATSGAAPLAVQLTHPNAPFGGGAGAAARGSANGPDLFTWNIEYGVGTAPTSWTPIADGNGGVANGLLANWSTASLPDGTYTLRLTARKTSGETYEDRMIATIDSVAITAPSQTVIAPYRAGDTVVISGTVAPGSFSGYTMSVTGVRVGLLPNPQITLANGGQQAVVNGVLGSWNTTGVAADHYRVCVRSSSYPYSQECTTVLVDPTLHPGWPQDLGGIVSGPVAWALTNHLTAEDLDGDGAKELLVAYGGSVRVFVASGSQLSGWPQTVDPNNAGAGVQHGPAAGDVTGDGVPEVVAVNNKGQAFVWSSDGSPLPGWPKQLLSSYATVTVDDLNGDGLNEIILTGSAIVVVDATGAALPGWPKGGTGQVPPMLGDVDGDGRKEIVVKGELGPHPLYVYRADGSLLPGWPQNVDPGVASNIGTSSYPALGDLDGDGRVDIVASARNGTVYAFRYDGTQLPGWPQPTKGVIANSPAIGDIDGDGLPEVVVGDDRVNGTEDYIFAWHGDGSLLPGWPVKYERQLSRSFFGYGAAALADIDGDGKADVIASSDAEYSTPFALNAYRFDGTRVGDFPRPTLDIGAYPPNTVAVADLDGDGLLEMGWIDGSFNLFVWDLTAPSDGPLPWPMFLHDAGHTGGLPPSEIRLALRVNGTNAGQGSVLVSPGGYSCDNFTTPDKSCAVPLAPGSLVTLDATPALGSTFESWGGACTGTSPTCELTLDGYRSVTATFKGPNGVPVANAGGPYAAYRNQVITFNGSASSDPDGDALTFAWDFGDGATGTGPTPSHAYAALGSYAVSLVVSDGTLTSTPATATATISNRAPTARAGGPYSGTNAAAVVFNGTTSSDPDGDPLTYNWTFGDGGFGSGPTPAHQYLVAGIYTVTLTVSDGLAASTVSTTTATISDVVPPAAVTDLTITTAGARSVTLAWTASGNNGSLGTATQYDLRYSTAPIDAASFASATAAVGEPAPKPAGSAETFTVSGLLSGTTYYFALKVSDAAGNTSGLSNVVSAITGGVTIFSDNFESGAGLWTIAGSNGTGGPALWHLSTYRSASPTTSFYYGIDASRTYNTGARNFGSITSVPISLGGAVGSFLSFKYFLQKEGATSYDLARVYVSTNGGSTWTQLGTQLAAAATITSAGFDLSAYDGQTIRVKFDLDTIDSALNTYEGWYVDDVRIEADSQTPAPVARPGGPYSAIKHQAIVFDGSASTDPEGDPLNFSWTFGDGTTGSGVTPSHVYDSAGTFLVTLVVDDGVTASVPVTTTATVTNRAPIAVAGGPYSAAKGATLTFDGTGSSDPDGDPLTFSWGFGDGTAGSGGSTPTHAYLTAGSFNVTLMVYDGTAWSGASVTTASITDTVPPAAVANLAATAPNSRSVVVAWTATGDDGTAGTASLYDLRYSTAPIDATNFASATGIPAPAPKAAGLAESVTLSALTPQTTYYFALRVRDVAGNWSGLSNVASATTRAEVAVFVDNVETGGAGWTIAGTNGTGGPSLWHVGTHRYSSPTHAFYYGLDATHTFDTGARNFGTLTSPPIDLAGAHNVTLSLQHLLQKETSTSYDKATILVSTNGGSTWNLLATPSTVASMTPLSLNLTAYQGQAIRLQFSFDTVDAAANNYEGWVIDDVRVAAETLNHRPVANAGPDQNVNLGTPVTLDGSGSTDPDAQALTFEWRDALGNVVGNSATVTLSLPAGTHDFTLTASDGELSAEDSVRIRILGQKRLTLNLASAENGYGSVAYDPPAPGCDNLAGGGNVSCEREFVEGTVVTLMAVAAPDSVFEGWLGACNGTAPTCQVTVADDLVVGAGFRGPQTLTLDLSSFENGAGAVTTDVPSPGCANTPGSPPVNCVLLFKVGTVLTLTANPTPDSVFEGWVGACSGTAPTCQVTVTDDLVVGAGFRGPQTLTLDLSSFENGAGAMTTDVPSPGCANTPGSPPVNCVLLFKAGTVVTLTANPTPDSVFEGWLGACNGTAPTCQVTVADDLVVGAGFRGPQTLTLDLSSFENGAGAVTTDVPSPGCANTPGSPPVNCVLLFKAGTVLTLTANPTPDSVFEGWVGACSGTAPTCQVTVADDLVVGAAFRGPQTLTLVVQGEGSGQVQAVPPSSSCQNQPGSQTTCSYLFAPGTAIRLTATAAADSLFQSWAGACAGQGPQCDLTIADDVSTTAVFVLRNHPPTASAGGPYTGVRNQAVTFNGTGSSDSDGDSLTYDWTFGDGATGTGASPVHAYTSLGTFDVTLRVHDGTAYSNPAGTTVVITNRAPVANAGGPYSGTRLQAVTFDGSGSSDPDGEALSYEWSFGDGTTGTGPTPSHSYSQLGSFSVTLVVRDGTDASAPSTANVQITNVSPSVALTSPSPGSVFTVPAGVPLAASASDPDGIVSKVEFYAGATKIGEDLSAPYDMIWSGAPVGTYAVTAWAIDDSGAVVSSAPVSITLNAPPSVALTAPAHGAQFASPASIPLAASASDLDGAVMQVEFFQGSTSLGTATTSPYGLTWTNVAVGTYTLTARATDNHGVTVASAPITVKVTAALAPASDAYVRGGSANGGRNFGTATVLTVQQNSSAGNQRWTYVKFDLLALPSISSAKLRLFGSLSATTSATVQTAAYPVSNTTWTETGITWNNKPASGTTALATVTLVNNSTTARWYEWDVTAYLQQEKTAGRSIVSLALKNLANSSPFDSFNSREATGNRPELLVVP